MPVRIRRARPTDARRLCNLMKTSVRVLAGNHYPPSHVRAWADPLEPSQFRQSITGGELVFVAEQGRRFAGFSSLFGDEVRAVFVHPASARRGVGGLLLKKIEREATKLGLERLWLWSSLNAIPFYRSQGYRGSRRTMFAVAGRRLSVVKMTKRLTP